MITQRLVLRRWRDDDREPFAALNADPVVMRHFPGLLDRRASDDLIQRIEQGFDANGFGLWAVELRDTGEFLGFTGLAVPRFTAAFTPCVEVGWRFAQGAWGDGYATEAARAAVAYGFTQANLTEIVSFTTQGNEPSRAVMRRLHMTHKKSDDFQHPAIAPGHPLRTHVLYRLARSQWERCVDRPTAT